MHERWGTKIVVALAATCLGAGVAIGALFARPGGSGESSARVAGPAVERASPTAAYSRAGTGDDRRRQLGAAAVALSRVPQLQTAPAPSPAPEVQDHRHITMDDLPRAVREVLGQLSLGRKMHKLELQTGIRRGVRLYRGEFELDGIEHEYVMDEAGKIVASELDVPVTDLPAPVVGGIQALLSGATVMEAEREQEGDAPPYFEVDVQHQGQRHELHVTENGQVLRHRVR